MNARFYVYKNDETLGPYTREEIEARVSTHVFTPEDLFWCDGMAKRMPLSNMGKENTAPALIPSQSSARPFPKQISQVQTRTSVTIDKLLMIGGAIFLFYFYLVFDSTVRTTGGDRVNNLGLMQDRTMGCVVSVGAIVVGAILRESGRKKSHSPQ